MGAVKRQKNYYHNKEIIAKGGDAEAMRAFVEEACVDAVTRKLTWFAANSTKHSDSWHSYLSATSILSGIKNGHTGVDCFFYVNLLRCHKKKIGKIWSSDHFLVSKDAKNIIVDIDNHPTATTIEELIDDLKSKGVIIPRYISQTSSRSFHLVYLGDRISLSQERVETLCAKIAGVEKKPMQKREFHRLLRKGGVDPNSFLVGHESHKMRVPGSVNSKRDDGWVVKGWSNENYLYNRTDFLEALGEVGIFYEEKKRHLRIAEKYENEFWRKDIPKIVMILVKVLPRKTAAKTAEFFAKRFGWLKEDRCNIRGEDFADFMNWGQQYGAKILRKLTNFGIIKMVKDYIHDPSNPSRSRARSYGLGDIVRSAFAKKECKKPKINLTIPYTAGQTWDQMSEDIRNCYGQGASESQIVNFVMKKQQITRSHRSQRPKKDIKSMVENWVSKFHSDRNPGFFRPPKCLIDFDEEIRKMEDGT